jgi:hypothetical protein
MEVIMDPNAVVLAVLAIVNGGLAVPIVNLLKGWLKITGGWQSYALTLAEVAIVTAGYLVFALKAFTWPLFLMSTVYAFLQASKLYDEIQRRTA